MVEGWFGTYPTGCTRLVRFLAVLLFVCLAWATPAAGGDFYIGATAAAERIDVLYEKAVDNSDPQNLTLSKGQVIEDLAAANKLAYSYGFLAGYKIPLSITGVYVALEVDTLRHGGIAAGRLLGSGTSPGRNQLGEVWPEDWTFERDRSFGLTARLGAGIPLIGTWFGPSIYGLVGVRRMQAAFRSEYTGCVTETPCTDADQFESGTDTISENFSGWTVGGGVEQKFGPISLRGEARVTDYSNAVRVTEFDDLFVSIPVGLQPSSISLGLSAIWYF